MGEWLSLMEFATRNSVSLSTLRRQIKSGRVQHRSDGGKYFIWDPEAPARSSTPWPLPQADSRGTDSRIQELELQLRKAREEIVELKTLLAFYEEQPKASDFIL